MASEEEYVEDDAEVMDDNEAFEDGEAANEEIESVAEEEGDATASGETAGDQVNVDSFDELRMNTEWVDAAQEAWSTFMNTAASREAAGEAIYAALFDAAPSLQSLFTTPRAIQAMKFMSGLNQFVSGLSDPPALKILVETLGFGHLALDVTVARVAIFRGAILDLFQVELGARFSTFAYNGWQALLNYVGGAIIFVKKYYADRIKLLGESWALANDKEINKDKFATMGSMEKEKNQQQMEVDQSGKEPTKNESMMQNVPTTFREMFQFNAAVMGFGSSLWMNEVLDCFDNIVTNVSNSQRLVEECDFLVCRISKVAHGKVNLAEFKSCMLASLRSLLPKDWTTSHEVAWSWLWENVERTLMKNMGMPPKWEKAYGKLLDGIDEATGFQLRRDIYLTFFSIAPAGQDYFKQSNTYLHLVATKVLTMVIDIFRDPVRMVDDISALGLRHVGYAIPTEYMPPFASACVQVVQGLTDDAVCIDGFQWSIGLVAKSLVRTIVEGSTIVMKSINVNSKKSMVRALSVAARGERAGWMLLIQVGTQNISPLAWAIESGALESGSAMIGDLLTIRADRDRYYYASDDLFARHHNIVQMLLNDAPALLPELLDGLVWRSCTTSNGSRRVNYYIKHLLVDADGTLAKNLAWVSQSGDTKLVCHPALVILSDLVWAHVACRSFTIRKMIFLTTLLCFIMSQSILPRRKMDRENKIGDDWERYTMFSLRMFIYGTSMGPNLVHHAKTSLRAFKRGDVVKLMGTLPFPSYLLNVQEFLTFCLMTLLAIMLATCPILYCLQDDGGYFLTDVCPSSDPVLIPNAVISMFAAFVYFFLLIDLAVFSNSVSAYVLACTRLFAEVFLFLIALLSVILTFSSAVSCLDQTVEDFQSIHFGALAYLELLLMLFDPSLMKQIKDEWVVLVLAFCFMVLATLFLSNLLIAQLTCAYAAVYEDMLGYARLKRIRVILDAMPQVPQARFTKFVDSLAFEKRIEFNEGDVGVGNGIATTEPSNAHPTSVDMIKRFGGSTSPSIQWPDETSGEDGADKFDRLELLIKRMTERRGKEQGGAKGSSMGVSSSNEQGASGSGAGSASQDDDLEEE